MKEFRPRSRCAPKAAMSSHPDHTIADLAAEFAANAKEREGLYEPSYDVLNYRFPAAVQARLDYLSERREELLAAISAAQTTSMVGHRAKALVLMDQYAPGGPADVPGLDSSEYLAWSLCRDLLADNKDAELIAACHRFAEAELDDWYCYIVAPEGEEDDDSEPNWETLSWITATPATTPEGWQAKALAYAAWHPTSYDDEPSARDARTTLLAALLRDVVAPARNAIISRLREKYGPLPEHYTADGVFLGRSGT